MPLPFDVLLVNHNSQYFEALHPKMLRPRPRKVPVSPFSIFGSFGKGAVHLPELWRVEVGRSKDKGEVRRVHSTWHAGARQQSSSEEQEDGSAR